MYDPTIGTFISRDPIAADPNLYRYCEDEPTSETDPSGLAPPLMGGMGLTPAGTPLAPPASSTGQYIVSSGAETNLTAGGSVAGSLASDTLSTGLAVNGSRFAYGSDLLNHGLSGGSVPNATVDPKTGAVAYGPSSPIANAIVGDPAYLAKRAGLINGIASTANTVGSSLPCGS